MEAMSYQAGWYQLADGRWRYFDGRLWTDYYSNKTDYYNNNYNNKAEFADATPQPAPSETDGNVNPAILPVTIVACLMIAFYGMRAIASGQTMAAILDFSIILVIFAVAIFVKRRKW